MELDWSQYSVAELRAHQIATFRQGGGSRPDVLLIDIEGHLAVLKDQNGADKGFATLIGPLLNWRETKALKQLSQSAFVPKLLAVPNSRSFLMTYHESKQITKLGDQAPDWTRFFSRLEAAVAEMHEIGIAHNDLRNPTNTLVTPDGEPVLVDLVACFSRGPKWNFPQRWLFHKFCQVDKSAITKLKLRFAPHLVNTDDVHPEAIAGSLGLLAKRFGQLIRKLSKKLFTK